MDLKEVIMKNVGRDIFIKPSNIHSVTIEKYQTKMDIGGFMLFGKDGDGKNRELYIVDSEITSYEDDLGMVSFEALGSNITYQGFIKDAIGLKRIY